MLNINKKNILQFMLFLVGILFISRLFFLQIVNNQYKIDAYSNTVQKFIEQPFRGEIFDRNKNIIIYNEPIYNLYVIPNKIKINKKKFCEVFEITEEVYENKLKKCKSYSRIKESIFIKNISHEFFSKIQHLITDFKGFDIQPKTTRKFKEPILSNIIGYLSEISFYELKKSQYYNLGDLKGFNGLEKQYEKYLRGEKGTIYNFIDVSGRKKGSFKNGLYDKPTESGKDLIITIDTNLQKYCNKLMRKKIGSIVILEPKKGEILAMGTYPSYDPNMLRGKNFSKNYLILKNDSRYPLFDRSIMAMYPPGSIFKIVNALIGLQEGVISYNTVFPCKQNIVKCHRHKSPCNLYDAIKNSCNPYFLQVFKNILKQKVYNYKHQNYRYNLEKWRNYVLQFGFGEKLNIDLPNEKRGYIPTLKYYDNKYGFKNWRISTIRSLDIGQGELLITPLQMANLAAIFANRGYYITPHLVKSIKSEKITFFKKTINIDKKHFEFVVEAMSKTTEATAKLAYIENLTIVCKTGTVENPHGKDHAVFIGFAPKDNPKIALVVFVENGGWGSVGAAPIGGLILEKYLRGYISKKRKWIEDYVLNMKA